jgi:hypothetical protein
MHALRAVKERKFFDFYLCFSFGTRTTYIATREAAFNLSLIYRASGNNQVAPYDKSWKNICSVMIQAHAKSVYILYRTILLRQAIFVTWNSTVSWQRLWAVDITFIHTLVKFSKISPTRVGSLLSADITASPLKMRACGTGRKFAEYDQRIRWTH